MEEAKRGPISKGRVGRFQVTMWRRRKVVPAGHDGFWPEREFDSVRACVQYSRYNRIRGDYERQQIWCDPIELRDMVGALDKLNADEGGEGQ